MTASGEESRLAQEKDLVGESQSGPFHITILCELISSLVRSGTGLPRRFPCEGDGGRARFRPAAFKLKLRNHTLQLHSLSDKLFGARGVSLGNLINLLKTAVSCAPTVPSAILEVVSSTISVVSLTA